MGRKRINTLFRSLTLLLLTVGMFLKNVAILNWFTRMEVLKPQSSSQHSEDSKKPVHGALDKRRKKPKTEDRSIVTKKNDAQGGEKV